jgi:hypothetical protein
MRTQHTGLRPEARLGPFISAVRGNSGIPLLTAASGDVRQTGFKTWASTGGNSGPSSAHGKNSGRLDPLPTPQCEPVERACLDPDARGWLQGAFRVGCAGKNQQAFANILASGTAVFFMLRICTRDLHRVPGPFDFRPGMMQNLPIARHLHATLVVSQVAPTPSRNRQATPPVRSLNHNFHRCVRSHAGA